MAKDSNQFICQECGSCQPKWTGQCAGCGAWNTLLEEKKEAIPKGMSLGKGKLIDFVGLEGSAENVARHQSGMAELDRVLGGGLVPGSAILVGGDPGIGKSTLLLQIVAALSQRNLKCAYVSGEEAIDQVRLRAQRLNVEKSPVRLAAASNVRDILSSIEKDNKIDVLIIDSIQTMYVDSLDSAPGTVSQVRASALELIRVAKKTGITVFLVGHVTKEGMIAGPRVLEHMVDTVLYFEGDRGHHFRILRSVKNRFGATDEIGVFEMTQLGLAEVANPSALFLADRSGDVSGSAVFAGIEGTRPVLVEIQALVAPSPLGTPRRAVVGWDQARLSMILAVLEARCGVVFSGKDIYLNIAGGLRVQEPAADLAVAAALLSAITSIPVPKEAVVFGEIGLAGEVRAVGQSDVRLKEASKLGFERAIIPKKRKNDYRVEHILQISEINYLSDLVALFDDQQRKDVA